MKLLKDMLEDFGEILLNDISEEDGNIEINSLVYDTRSEIVGNSIFVCIKGASYDSHDFAAEAVSKGAKVVVTERKLEIPDTAVQVQVSD